MEGSHPHLSTCITLCETVTGGNVGDPFVETGEDEGSETKADLPFELLGVIVSY